MSLSTHRLLNESKIFVISKVRYSKLKCLFYVYFQERLQLIACLTMDPLHNWAQDVTRCHVCETPVPHL